MGPNWSWVCYVGHVARLSSNGSHPEPFFHEVSCKLHVYGSLVVKADRTKKVVGYFDSGSVSLDTNFSFLGWAKVALGPI